MKNSPRFYPRNFEKAIFNLISLQGDINNSYFNQLLDNIYKKYKPIAVLSATKYHLDSDFVDDILQEAIVLLILRIRAGKFVYNTQLGFKSFLYSTLKYLCFNINKKYNLFMLDALENDSTEYSIENPFDYEFPQTQNSNCSLFERVEEIIKENLSPQGSNVLALSLLKNRSNQEGAAILGYKDESIFRKKKSKHLNAFRNKISSNQKDELIRLAS